MREWAAGETRMNRRMFIEMTTIALAGTYTRAWPETKTSHAPTVSAFSQIEKRIGGRVGVFAMDSGTGNVLQHRADERFAMCSTFKWALAAAVLSHVDRSILSLKQTVPYDERDLLSYAPVTRAHMREGRMTIESLAQAAVVVSDNTAANLLLKLMGGPTGVTRFFRDIGDQVTRLDRNEPTLNENAPGDMRDTTSPRAMAFSLRKVLIGDALSQASRARLINWLLDCKTGLSRLRAGLPAWKIGDKTGSGGNGACNDVAIAFGPTGAPWLIASYLSESQAPAKDLDSAHAEIGRIVAEKANSQQTGSGSCCRGLSYRAEFRELDRETGGNHA